MLVVMVDSDPANRSEIPIVGVLPDVAGARDGRLPCVFRRAVSGSEPSSPSPSSDVLPIPPTCPHARPVGRGSACDRPGEAVRRAIVRRADRRKSWSSLGLDSRRFFDDHKERKRTKRPVTAGPAWSTRSEAGRSRGARSASRRRAGASCPCLTLRPVLCSPTREGFCSRSVGSLVGPVAACGDEASAAPAEPMRGCRGCDDRSVRRRDCGHRKGAQALLEEPAVRGDSPAGGRHLVGPAQGAQKALCRTYPGSPSLEPSKETPVQEPPETALTMSGWGGVGVLVIEQKRRSMTYVTI